MAQNMKISVVKPTGENIIITVNENEPFLEVQSKILKEHNICLSPENFSTGFISIAENDNLHDYLKEHFVNDNANDLADDKPVYEINLLEKNSSQMTNTVVKCENNSPYVINEDSTEHYNVYKEVQNLDTSLMVLNQEQTNEFTTELNDNLFESAVYEQATNIKSEESNQGITLYGADESVLMTEDYQLIETNSVAKTSEVNQDKVDTNTGRQSAVELSSVLSTDGAAKDVQSDQSYNYMDIESKLREIHDYSEESMTDLCRLCAGNLVGVNKVLIYSENSVSDKLEEKINGSLPVKVVREDGLPQQLCDSCVTRVKTFHEFVQVVTEADKVLRLKFKTTDTANDSLKENSVSEFISEFLSSPAAELVADEPTTKIVKTEPDTSDSTNYEVEYLDINTAENKTDKDSLTCRLCDLIIDKLSEAVSHSLKEHNINGLYACAFCDLGFTNSSSLSAHIQSDHKRYFDSEGNRRHRRYKCQICLKKYATQFQLYKHTCAAKSTFNKTLHCEVCNQAFPTKVRLNFHRQFHLKDARPLYCSICNISFEVENELFDHVNFIHESRQVFACGLCDKTFSIRSALNNHKKIHTGERNHKCETCNKSFLDRQTLKEHEVSHMETKPYQCHICGKNLNRLSRLRKHLLTHESNPVVNDIHVCKVCKETFADQRNANLHQTSKHANEKCIEIISTDRVFRCEFCEKCFSSPLALNEHRTAHTGQTPYVCHICKAHFSSYSRCTTHKTTHGLYKDGAEKDNYPVVKHFLCEHCGKSYLHWTYLVLHRRLKHSEVVHMYKCNECFQDFPTSWGLAYHRKSKHSQEQFKCGDCGKCMSNYHSLKLHQLTQHCDKKNKDIQCEKCGKIFVHQNSLEAHMKLHQGIKEYKCSFCPKTFVHPSGLSNHVKVHKSRKHVYGSKYILPKPDQDPIRIGNADRPFNCDICGLAFRREFTLRNHRFKHAQVSEAGSFVLMVDMKEDESAEMNKPKESVQTVEVPVQEKHDVQIQEPTITQITNENGLAENYIDIGNGNYLQVQGNTFSIGGKEYILVDENGKSINRNHEFEMIVDETLREEEPAEDTNNMVTDQQFADNQQIMLVESGGSSYMLNQNDGQQQYIFTTTERSTPKTTATYVIGGNQFMLETDDQAF